MKKIKINVTQNDIDNTNQCPMERAMENALDKRCYVGYNVAGSIDGTRQFLVPARATKFIKDFDAGKTVQPDIFEFEEIDEKEKI